MTQAEVAERLSVTQPIIAKWEKGSVRLNSERLEPITRVLGISPSLEGDPSAFATWLVRTRINKGFSVAELANKSSVAIPTIYAIESGRINNPRQKTVGKLERSLGEKVPADTAAETEEQATIEGLGELVGIDPHVDDDVPAVPGIYVFCDINERPIYVGESGNIKHRLRDHRDKFWFRPPIVDTGAYIKIGDKDLRRKIETILIRFLKSNAVLNKQKVDR